MYNITWLTGRSKTIHSMPDIWSPDLRSNRLRSIWSIFGCPQPASASPWLITRIYRLFVQSLIWFILALVHHLAAQYWTALTAGLFRKSELQHDIRNSAWAIKPMGHKNLFPFPPSINGSKVFLLLRQIPKETQYSWQKFPRIRAHYPCSSRDHSMLQ